MSINIISLLALMLLCQIAKAQTIDDYLTVAAQNNPSLKVRYNEYYSALEKVPQAGTLPDPQLTFSMFVGKDGLYMERWMGQQLSEISAMQMFPWIGSLDAAKNEATYMAQMKFSAFQESKINLFHDVRTVWYQLYQVDEELKLLEKEKEILKTYEQLALTRFKTGTSGTAPMNTQSGTTPSVPSSGGGMAGMGGNTATPSPSGMPSGQGSGGMSGGTTGSMVDVLLIQLQMKELDSRIEILNASRKPLEVKFNNLLNRASSEKIILADTLSSVSLPATLSIIQDSVIQNHPMVKMYQWDEKAREEQQRMAKLMGRPMIGVGLTYMIFRPRFDEMLNENMGGENMFMPMVTMTLPIYRKKYTSLRKEAEYLQQSATQNKEAAKLDLLSELERLLFDYESSTRRLKLLHDQREITQQAIRLMTTTYSTGGGGMEEILRQRQSLLSYEQQQLSAITEQHITVSGITKLMGIESN
ncbi:MAG: TolC family protein [Cyclobacteriaceae bacterium]|nr:TolC family protein [Cyclobacteriaceae bacterium]UYN88501.1 MAG: TolC family protein [Cyclobacteriaceae bacterium]